MAANNRANTRFKNITESSSLEMRPIKRSASFGAVGIADNHILARSIRAASFHIVFMQGSNTLFATASNTRKCQLTIGIDTQKEASHQA